MTKLIRMECLRRCLELFGCYTFRTWRLPFWDDDMTSECLGPDQRGSSLVVRRSVSRPGSISGHYFKFGECAIHANTRL